MFIKTKLHYFIFNDGSHNKTSFLVNDKEPDVLVRLHTKVTCPILSVS